jgi:hypothetical protein
VWYRSRAYTGGWAVSYDVPIAVRRIDRPSAYVHYRGAAVAQARDHRAATGDRRNEVREHRPPAATAPARESVVRDHRRH